MVRGASLLLLLASMLSASAACRGSQAERAKEGAGNEESAADEATCERYAFEVCERAGTESPTCDAMRQAAAMLPPAACEVALTDMDYTEKRLVDARETCRDLVAKLCVGLGPKTETCALVAQETEQFPPERCATMLEHFDEVLADLQRLDAENAPLGEPEQVAIAAGDAPAFGPADARVVLVEFSDFQCPFCAEAAETVQKIRKQYGQRVRFVFRQFPLSFHHDAHLAAQAALAAHEQGKFFAYHDQLFSLRGNLGREVLLKEAEALSLDMRRFKQALDDARFADRVDADLELGEKVGVSGTPTLFLNGKRVDHSDFEALAKQIDELLGG